MATLPFLPAADGVRVALRVTPGGGRDRIGEVAEDADGAAFLKVSVTAAPERGKANRAVIALLAKEWRMPKSALAVSRGETDRRKTLSIAGEPAALMKRLESWQRGRNG